MKKKRKQLKKALEVAIEALEKRLEEEPYGGIVQDIHKRFKRAYEIVLENGDLNKAVVIGSCRAYMDSYTDYNNPMLDKVSEVEIIVKELTGYDERIKAYEESQRAKRKKR